MPTFLELFPVDRNTDLRHFFCSVVADQPPVLLGVNRRLLHPCAVLSQKTVYACCRFFVILYLFGEHHSGEFNGSELLRAARLTT